MRPPIVSKRFGAIGILIGMLPPPLTASAGTWGQENWGEMYWGSNPVSAPVAAPSVASIVADGSELVITIDNYPEGTGADGWSVVTSYTVTCGEAGSVQAEGSPVRVTGLESDTEYDCVVTANNAAGASPSVLRVASTDSDLQGLGISILYVAACRSANPPASCSQ